MLGFAPRPSRPVVCAGEEEELDRPRVELQGDGLEEGYVVRQHLLVVEVEVVFDEFLRDVVVAEEVKERRLLARVLNHDGEGLQQLQGELGRPWAGPGLLHEPTDVRHHLELDEEVEEARVVLVAVDHELRDLAKRLHQVVSVRGRHRGRARERVRQPTHVRRREPVPLGKQVREHLAGRTPRAARRGVPRERGDDNTSSRARLVTRNARIRRRVVGPPSFTDARGGLGVMRTRTTREPAGSDVGAPRVDGGVASSAFRVLVADGDRGGYREDRLSAERGPTTRGWDDFRSTPGLGSSTRDPLSPPPLFHAFSFFLSTSPCLAPTPRARATPPPAAPPTPATAPRATSPSTTKTRRRTPASAAGSNRRRVEPRAWRTRSR